MATILQIDSATTGASIHWVRHFFLIFILNHFLSCIFLLILANFSCNVPERQIIWMQHLRSKDNLSDCSPAIECLIEDAHGSGSILEEEKTVVHQQVPYDSYFPIRIIAEIFPIIIHMLLNIAIVIATRETSVGRGNIGHQWAFYPIGVLVFASILGVINHAVDFDQFIIPMIVFPITMFVCAIVVLFSG